MTAVAQGLALTAAQADPVPRAGRHEVMADEPTKELQHLRSLPSAGVVAFDHGRGLHRDCVR
jgi:hypothetical protein